MREKKIAIITVITLIISKHSSSPTTPSVSSSSITHSGTTGWVDRVGGDGNTNVLFPFFSAQTATSDTSSFHLLFFWFPSRRLYCLPFQGIPQRSISHTTPEKSSYYTFSHCIVDIRSQTAHLAWHPCSRLDMAVCIHALEKLKFTSTAIKAHKIYRVTKLF